MPESGSWEGNGPCKDCGGANIRWHAPHDLWMSVVECIGGGGGLLCPTCFVKRAYAKGVDRYMWLLMPVPYNLNVEGPPVGAVLTPHRQFTGQPLDLLDEWYAGYVNNSGAWDHWHPHKSGPCALCGD